MKRQEQIEEYIRFHANKFSVRMGYTTVEDLMRGMAKWCDNNPVDANKATMTVHPVDAWNDAKEHKPEAVEQKEFGHRKLSKQVLCVYEDGKCHVERYDHDCVCWRWANGYGQMHEPKMWRYIDIPEGGMK